MKVNSINPYVNSYNTITRQKTDKSSFYATAPSPAPVQNINFKSGILQKAKNFVRYKQAQKTADELYKYISSNNLQKEFLLRNYKMEALEGLQYGIKAFEGLSMKEIQYLCENLHVIAVKRGCNHMCGHCYADAKPQKREMSWEDFTQITTGLKTLRDRFHGLDIFGENIPINRALEKTTELYYDADCMDLAIKDKDGNIHDFIELSDELYEKLGRKTVFDTSGWAIGNDKMQKRAEKYAEHFSKKENMDKLRQFNVSFNVFNPSYIASRKALKKGDTETARRLKDKFLNNTVNTLYTFTPVIENPEFGILLRSFGSNAKRADGFNQKSMAILRDNMIERLKERYLQDLGGEQKYIKTKADLERKIAFVEAKTRNIDTGLNSSGRMKSFMDEFGIKAPLQDHTETTKFIIDSLNNDGRLSRNIMMRLIDTDGKVYHMDYARFFPTQVQLNIPGKDTPSPRLANTIDSFTVTKEILNKL